MAEMLTVPADRPGTIRIRFEIGRLPAAIVVDGLCVGRPRSLGWSQLFEVEPGERRVAVGREQDRDRDRSGPLTVRVEPGGRVDLACSTKPGWAEFDGRSSRIFRTLGFLYPGCALVGALVAPTIGPAISASIAGSRLPGPIVATLRSLTTDRLGVVWLFFLATLFPALAACLAWWRWRVHAMEAEYGPRFSLAVVREADGTAHSSTVATSRPSLGS